MFVADKMNLMYILYCCSWFHGNISRDEVLQRINAAKNGLFIVRNSSTHPGDYSLSVSFKDSPFHYHIKTNDKNQVSLSGSTIYYDNLVKLVEHYQADKYDLPVRLRTPVDKEEITKFMSEIDAAKQVTVVKQDELLAPQRPAVSMHTS